MKEFITLLGQIFVITCLQSIIELFIDPATKSYQIRLINIACFLGSLYFLLNFINNVMLSQIASVFKFNF